MKYVSILSIVVAGIFWGAANAAPVPIATWDFNNTLAADEPGVPALIAIDPLGKNRFMTDDVLGVSQTVYRFDGNKTPSEQAGLVIGTKELLKEGDAYSVEMIFQLEASQSTWKNIFGVSNRQSDNAFYVEPGNKLQVYPNHGGPTNFTFGQYHHVTLTNDGHGHVTSYLDGVFQFDLKTDIMSFATYSSVNPDRLIHFFVDNVVGGGQGEYANGRVVMIRLYAAELAKTEVSRLGAAVAKERLALFPAYGMALLASDIATCNAPPKAASPKGDMTFEEYKKTTYKDFDAYKKGTPNTEQQKAIDQRRQEEAEAKAAAERVVAESKRLQIAVEGALLEGLRQKYEVLPSAQVTQGNSDAANQECVASSCLKQTADNLQAKFAAVVTLTKSGNNYLQELSIQNVAEHKVVYSKSATAAKCSETQVVKNFKGMSSLPK